MQRATAVRVRLFKPSDSEFVMSLIPRFSEFELPAWRTKMDVDTTNRNSIRRAMEEPEPDSVILIAEAESQGLAGFVHLQTQTDYFNGEMHGYISDLAVDQRFEGRGIGRMLLEAAEDWARAKGYPLLTLYVFAGNKRAQSLYEKHGFAPEVVK
jgi:ribosomal protein S18 acetylase RimI-like enzyme